MKSMKTLLSLLLIVLFSNCLVAQNPKMVKDIWDGSSNGKPFFFREFNNILYFNAEDGTNGVQFWRSDGTLSGTYAVKSIRTGAIFNIDNKLYFGGNDVLKGQEPWKSDGTTNGTVLIRDIVKGKVGSQPAFWAKSGNTIFFNPFVSSSEWALWKTDGTSPGTVQVKNINRRENDAVCYIHDVNGTLFFWADDGSAGRELWKSNGTEAGTIMVKDICPGATTSYYELFPEPNDNYKAMATQSKEVNANGIYYFLAYEPNKGAELWKSDGTVAGTVRITDINPDAGNASPHILTVMGDYLYFSATDGTTGYELWKVSLINGTYSQVLDINPNGDSYPMQLTVVNNALYFSANDGTNGRELWKYDGTNDPVAVTDLNGKGDGIESQSPFKMQNAWIDHWCFPSSDGIIYFEGTDVIDGNTNGWELWMYDTQTGSYSEVEDINPGSGSSDISWAEFVGGKLFFSANDGIHGLELWVYDPVSPRKGFYDNEEAIVTDNYKIMVYPNPADENIMISGSFNDKVNVEVRLLDMLGKELISQNHTGLSMLSESISLYGLAPGVYFVEMRFGSQTVQRKIIKR